MLRASTCRKAHMSPPARPLVCQDFPKTLEMHSKKARLGDKALLTIGMEHAAIPEAMTFKPTIEQFRDPLQYIQEIARTAHTYGIVKIVPPPGWTPNTCTTPRFKMLVGTSEKFTSKRLSVSKRMVVPMNNLDTSGLIFTLNVQNDFRLHTLKSFEAIPETQKRTQMFQAAGDLAGMESAFWNHVLNAGNFSVEYGSDVPGAVAQGSRDMATLANGSLLSSIGANGGGDISGVNTPMLYVGQVMSPFAFHCEDNNLYSINFLVDGACKIWYAVPGHKHMELESVVARMQELGGIDAQTSPSGLNRPLCDKVTMISPNLLLQAEVPVFKVCQYPGEIIITFPRAYHSGFSTGFNLAESINFATANWIPYGIQSLKEIRVSRRESVIDVEKLLVVVALDRDSKKEVMSEAHARILLLLISWACTVKDMAHTLYIQTPKPRTDESVEGDERHLCCVCCHSNYLCYVISPTPPYLTACPEHVGALGNVEARSLKLITRLSARDVVRLTGICKNALERHTAARRTRTETSHVSRATRPVRATGSGKACKDAVTQVKNAQASGEEGGGLVMHSSVVRGFAGEPLLDLSLCHPEVCAVAGSGRSGVPSSKLVFPVSPLFLAAGP